jgi:hypothetical protein
VSQPTYKLPQAIAASVRVHLRGDLKSGLGKLAGIFPGSAGVKPPSVLFGYFFHGSMETI